jgi:hypothetical protein
MLRAAGILQRPPGLTETVSARISQKVAVGVVFVAAGLGGAGAGGVGRVEHVDVDRQVQRRVADALADPVHDTVDIHPNTLLYRIRRFEQISGRSLASTESLAEVWLAMRTTAAVPEG